jgi:hypothetical protein
MIANVVPVRVLHGRSQDNNRCRRSCGEYETLAHVLGSCPFGELLRNVRHHKIRSIIAQALKDKHKCWEVYEEVHCLASDGSTRRVDILALDKSNSKAYVLDPTIRFETNKNQPEEVNLEKQSIYNSTTGYFKEHYKINDLEVIGLFRFKRNNFKICCKYLAKI